ncbi:MAG TPA: aspartyl protease family protein [Verrucomicrobiae bacterium]|nr:aspartyl protease family protein [Verrucomicrobiae bacterium]
MSPVRTILTALWLIFAAGAFPALAQMHGEGQLHADSISLVAGQVTVPMTLVGRHPRISVMLDGKGPYQFVLDTGAHGSVVDAAVAKELQLVELGDSELHSPLGKEGSIPSKLVRIERLDLADARVTGARAATMDLAGLFMDKSVAGVLSPNVFAGCLVTLDYPNSTVTVAKGSLPPADGARIFEFAAGAPLPEVRLEVAGIEIPAHVDSGSAGGISLPTSYAEKLPLAAPPVEVHRARTVDREFVILGADLKGEVALGSFKLRNPQLTFSELPMANLGYDFLRRFAVTLDVSQHRVRFEEGTAVAAEGAAPAPGPAIAPAPAPRRYGVRLKPSDSGVYEVVGTDPGSPAEKAGLLAGDRILKINGTPAKDLDTTRLGEMLHASPVKLAIQRDGKESEISMALD